MRKELLLFARLRQEFLLSSYHPRLAQAKTVLIASVPREPATEADLRQLFSFVPGGIKRIWIHNIPLDCPKPIQERMDLCDKLEGAATGLLQTAIKARIQEEEKAEKDRKSAGREGKILSSIQPSRCVYMLTWRTKVSQATSKRNGS